LSALAHRPDRRVSPRKPRGYRHLVRQRSWGRSHQNYFRDYDPAVGRYVESDPIGLIGGTNTYAYTASSPINLYDPKGLTWYWPVGTNVGSGRVICNGKNGLTIDISFLSAAERKCVGDCVRLHELVHVMDFRRIDPQVCQGIGPGLVPSFDTAAENNASENRAYDASTECLRRKLAGMSDCDSCKATVQLFLNDAPRARAASMR
jgi:RHS repeat-associated protein